MTCKVEPLERRTLLALTVPGSVMFAYDNLLVDDVRLKADVAAARTTLAADRRTLAADVRAVGETASNRMLLRQAGAAGAKAVAGLATATSRFVTAVAPAARTLEVAATLFAYFPSTATAKRLTAAQAGLGAVQGKPLNALVATVANAGVPFATAANALAAANPAAAGLTADVQAADNDQAALSATRDAQLTKVEMDLATLLGVE